MTESDFWDNNYYNHPSLTDEMVKNLELTYKVDLPKLLVKLLKIQNGGYTKGFAYPMDQKTSWSENHVPLNELFGIVTDKSIQSPHNILDSAYMTKEWGLPEKQLILSGDGHWWITLDYREKAEPTIRWIDTECNEDIHIANSFEEFFNGLVSEDEFTE